MCIENHPILQQEAFIAQAWESMRAYSKAETWQYPQRLAT